jgi:hypothetical protein
VNTTIPVEIVTIVLPFATIFTKPVWSHAQILLVGAILTTGKRTITSVLAVMGVSKEEHFRALSSRIKSCGVVKFRSKQSFTDNVGSNVCAKWSDHHGYRRYN